MPRARTTTPTGRSTRRTCGPTAPPNCTETTAACTIATGATGVLAEVGPGLASTKGCGSKNASTWRTPPAAARLYALTEAGRQLEPVLLALGRWGSRVPIAPMGPVQQKKHGGRTTGEPEQRRLSLRSGFTAYNGLSPVTGFLATVVTRILPQT